MLVQQAGNSSRCKLLIAYGDQNKHLMAMYSSQRAKSLDKLLDDIQWVMNMVTAEGFRPLKKEAECFFTAGLITYTFLHQ